MLTITYITTKSPLVLRTISFLLLAATKPSKPERLNGKPKTPIPYTPIAAQRRILVVVLPPVSIPVQLT
jgi:hypothetical protein